MPEEDDKESNGDGAENEGSGGDSAENEDMHDVEMGENGADMADDAMDETLH